MNMFDLLETPEADASAERESEVPLPNVPRWSNTEQLKFEKEALDFYFSSHPLAEFDIALKRFTSHEIGKLRNLDNGAEIRIGGMLSGVRFFTSKRGDRYVRCKVEDFTGQAECVMWPSDFQRHKEHFVDDRIYLCEATVEWGERDDPIMVLNRLLTIEEAKKELTRGLILRLQLGRHGNDVIDGISRILKRCHGPCFVYMQVLDPAGRVAQLCLGENWKVDPGKLNVEELEMLLGNGAVLFTGK